MASPPSGSEKSTPVSDSANASVSPSSVSDQPTKVDTLGFKPYVEAVAAFLIHPDTRPPLTLSVEGTWGSGKSSFMLQLEARIREKKGGKTVWFNAWRHDKEEELWAAFALDFTNKLAARFPFWKRWLFHLKLACLRFNWRRGWFRLAKFVVLALLFLYVTIAVVGYARKAQNPLQQFFSPRSIQTGNEPPKKPEEVVLALLLKMGGTAAYILLGFALVRKIADLIGNPLEIRLTDYIRDPKYETHAAFIDTFHTDFDRLVRTYSEGKRVFIFIDDLDRCEVPKAADLMQALNLLISESAPVFYILGLDREKIAAGLAVKYEKLMPYLSGSTVAKGLSGSSGIEFGYAYLEKFIQLPFLVPQPADRDVDKLLDSLGKTAKKANGAAGERSEIDLGLLVELSADSDSIREVVKMVAASLDYNPRRIKQFLNLFRLRALLASQTGLFGTPQNSQRFDPLTLEQLGKLVAILLRWPLLFVDLETDPELLGRLQSYALGSEKSIGEPLDQFWAAKHNLMELIAFRVSETGPNRFGLHRLDVERFLQVSPPVRGRENIESTKAPDVSKTRSDLPPESREGPLSSRPGKYESIAEGPTQGKVSTRERTLQDEAVPETSKGRSYVRQSAQEKIRKKK
jgi:hypothetical protein